jgi:diaminohydroxyphosphoribosylaminopyrimidine deaminase/5-amino-6-(5-phosphoribosylamino)uracil reductase
MPPCTDALIHAGVRRVVCAALDANPQVRGAGVRQLQSAGIHVESGLLVEEARELNAGFEKRMLHGIPRVTVKLACSLDGRAALANGASQWLTGPAARADVQRLRAAAAAVITGIETVLHDDPRLTVRDPMLDLAGRQPLRVVLDSRLRMPTSARMLSEPGDTWVIAATDESEKAAVLRAHGATIHCVGNECRLAINLRKMLHLLAEHGCNDVLVESGPTLAGALFESGLVDELVLYFSPMLIGPQAQPLLRLKELQQLGAAVPLRLKSHEQIGPDIKLVYELCDP